MAPLAGSPSPRRVLVLGGGFGGIYTALELERRLGDRADVEVTLVSRDNFFLFTPMLHEVAACDVELTNIVNPIRKLLGRTRSFVGTIEGIDLAARRVTVAHGYDRHTHDLPYDHLVLALGATTNFFGLPGVAEHALTVKSLADGLALRNQVIGHLEEAATECAAPERDALLTFVVAGGGFAGVETIAGLNDFVRESLRFFPTLDEDRVRMILITPEELILPELGPKLGAYAQRKLAARGVEIVPRARVKAAAPGIVELTDGRTIHASTLIWTAGLAANPLVAALPLPSKSGRVVVNQYLEVEGHPGVWALGDGAVVPDPATGGSCPPTAQHAIRQGRTLATNLAATLTGGRRKPFRFRTLGQLAAIGRRSGVARILGINFSGFVAWWLWRTIYLGKLPRLEKKVRVSLDWTLDLLFAKDFTQVPSVPLRRMR